MADSSGKKVLDGLDHPIIFVLFMTFAVAGTMSLLTWGFKAAHMPGPAAMVQHP